VEEDRQDAVDVLHDALEWNLVPDRWRLVEQAVGELTVALAAGDEPGFRRAVSDVELAGPVRAVTARTPPKADPGPTPTPLRERINELIHQLGDSPVESSPPDVGSAR
jgi:hypothetical protein